MSSGLDGLHSYQWCFHGLSATATGKDQFFQQSLDYHLDMPQPGDLQKAWGASKPGSSLCVPLLQNLQSGHVQSHLQYEDATSVALQLQATTSLISSAPLLPFIARMSGPGMGPKG